MAPRSRRRAVVSFERAQLGDVATHDSAGGNIEYHGADAAAVVSEALGIVKDTFLDDQKRELRQAQVDAALAALAADLRTLRALALAGLALAIIGVGVGLAVLIALR